MNHKPHFIMHLAIPLLALGINTSWAAPPNPTTSDALHNTAGGSLALNLTIGSNNTGFGSHALTSNSQANNNTAIGAFALESNSTGLSNTATGTSALRKNTVGTGNTTSGVNTLFNNTTGNYNTAFGVSALLFNTVSSANTAVGVNALFNSSLGNSNTALGFQALYNKTSGGNNLALGQSAGINLNTGNNNIYLSNPGVASESSTIRIGNAANHTRAFIAGVHGRKTGVANAVAVYIDSNGQLGTIKSAQRFKKDIRDMDGASRRLLELHPVTYHYKEPNEDGSNTLEYGLIAEEVAKVYPDLVAYGADGEIETVQYHKLTPMLVNEVQHLNVLLLAERDKNMAQAKEISNLKRQMTVLQVQSERIEALTSRLSHIEAKESLGMVEKGVGKRGQNPG
jgi:polyhydroxyalkanoate synthesis regulator phasin